MGETLPQVKIAKKYIEKGGEGIFFSHGGKYEHLAKEIGCEVIKLKGLEWRKAMAEVDIFKIPVEKRQFLAYNKKTIGHVESEIEEFKKTGVDLVFSSFNPTSSISARALNIPLVVLISGTFISPYFQQGLATFPENYENVFTKILPLSLKNMIIRWILLNNRYLVRDFNKDAEKYNVKRFRTLNDILEGDPAKRIVEYTEENSIDLVVMGTLGKGRLERIFVGSVTEKVLKLSPVSVMVIK